MMCPGLWVVSEAGPARYLRRAGAQIGRVWSLIVLPTRCGFSPRQGPFLRRLASLSRPRALDTGMTTRLTAAMAIATAKATHTGLFGAVPTK